MPCRTASASRTCAKTPFSKAKPADLVYPGALRLTLPALVHRRRLAWGA